MSLQYILCCRAIHVTLFFGYHCLTLSSDFPMLIQWYLFTQRKTTRTEKKSFLLSTFFCCFFVGGRGRNFQLLVRSHAENRIVRSLKGTNLGRKTINFHPLFRNRCFPLGSILIFFFSLFLRCGKLHGFVQKPHFHDNMLIKFYEHLYLYAK